MVAAGMAELGHQVTSRVRSRADECGEPGLPTLAQHAIRCGRWSFSEGPCPDVLVVCGPTVDQLDRAGARIGDGVVVNTCVPPWASTKAVGDRLGRGADAVVSNPLALRAGRAVRDFLEPARIVIGADDERASSAAECLYGGVNAPVVRSDVRSADLIAPAGDGYCAIRHRFFEQLAELCAEVGVDARSVVECLRYDDRIECRDSLLPADPDEFAGLGSLFDMAGGDPGTPMLREFGDEGRGRGGSACR
ncbi:hypothetical protein GCM10027563_44990 [Parasphingorhabdus pacifica]